jgi:hypothetical protein
MADNFPKSMIDTQPQIQKAQRTVSRLNIQNTILRYHIKGNEKILKKARRKITLSTEEQE